MKIVEYKVLNSGTMGDLNNAVIVALSRGYELQGGYSRFRYPNGRDEHSQAVIKREEQESN